MSANMPDRWLDEDGNNDIDSPESKKRRVLKAIIDSLQSRQRIRMNPSTELAYLMNTTGYRRIEDDTWIGDAEIDDAIKAGAKSIQIILPYQKIFDLREAKTLGILAQQLVNLATES